MSFPLTILGIAVVFAAFIGAIRIAANAGTKKHLRHLHKLRRATPPHTYTNLDGSQGRWP